MYLQGVRELLAPAVIFLITSITLYGILSSFSSTGSTPFQKVFYEREHYADAIKVLKPVVSYDAVPCVGPRGQLLSENQDEQLQLIHLGTSMSTSQFI